VARRGSSEDAVWAVRPDLVTNVSTSAGSKPSASNSISAGLSNAGAGAVAGD
jgi:hypothetical protein